MSYKDIDRTKLDKYIQTTPPDHWMGKPGIEAYNYYAYLSTTLSKGSKIADLGTLQGLSALSLAFNPRVEVTSYDITQAHNIVDEKKNITFVLGNIFDYIDEILESDLILIDIDPHDGIQEKKFLDALIENEYGGLTVWDDIHLNTGMENFWRGIGLDKEDLTPFGHFSGTGIIDFRDKPQSLITKIKRPTKGLTNG